MQRIEAWQASDGKLFTNPDECKDYEFELTWIPLINEFLASAFNKYNQGNAGSIAKNAIIAWERFQGARIPQPIPEGAEECSGQTAADHSSDDLFPEGPLNPMFS
jgi:hypothetical protein